MSEPFYKLFNAGTSEGVKKAWETRKGAGQTSSGKTIPHPTDKRVYQTEGRLKTNDEFKEDTQGWSKQDHDEAAKAHFEAYKSGKLEFNKADDARAAAGKTRGYPDEKTRASLDAALAHWRAAGHRKMPEEYSV